MKSKDWFRKMMPTNLNFHQLNNKPLKMTKRNLYTYKLMGTIQTLQKRQNPKYPQYFYQLNINCLNDSTINKIFGFQPKLKNQTI
jgi:hypothetical protein